MKKNISKEKRFLAIALSIALVITTIPTIAFAKTEKTTDDKTYELIVSEKPHVEMKNQGGGYDPQTYDTSHLTTSRFGGRARTSLPSEFNRVTSGLTTSRMENQGRYGSCWTFATLGSAESSLFQQDNSTDFDFSQRHLAYFTYYGTKNTSDPADGTNNDKFLLQPGETHMQAGGNSQKVIATLSRGMGPELEANVPYSEGETAPPLSTEYNEAAFLENADFLPKKDETGNLDGTAIKTALMQKGSVYATYGANLADTQLNGDDYRTFYSNRTIDDVTADEYGGHAIQIIGWNDKIAAANFTDNQNGNAKPAGDGAWIIKNSWGDANQDKYFYMSYYTSSADNFCVFDMDKTPDLYDNNYQYDGVGYISSISLNRNVKYAYAANLFTANDNEVLKRIAFSTTDQDTNYSISIYTGLTDNTNPTSGTSAFTSPQKGTAAYMGYHTIELAEPVNLKKGEQFSVVVRFEQPNATLATPVPLEKTHPNYSTAEIQPNQSFVALNTGLWYDMTNNMFSGFANVCIKAFTDTIKEDISISANKQAEISGDSLQDAVAKSKIEIAKITELDITAGGFTKADWEYLKSLTELTSFNIKKEITSVESMPDATASSSIFPKKIQNTFLAKVSNISKFAFNGCESLLNATIPNATSIGEFSFKGCTKLSLLGLPTTPPNITDENVFEGSGPEKSIAFFVDFSQISSISSEAKQARKDYKAVSDGNINDNKWYTCIIVAEYSVFYMLDGGENSPDNPALVTLDSPITILSAATKKGYTFVGWFDAQVGGQQVLNLDGLGEKNINLYARFTENIVTSADFAVSPPANSDGWHNSAITITPKNGYEKIWDSETSSWASLLTFSSEGAAGDINFKLRKADGTETTNYTLNNIKIDTLAPTDAAIKLETNLWTQFLNTVTFGLFFNESKTVEISATDTNDIKSIEYLISDKVFNQIADIKGTWNNLSLSEGVLKNFKGTFTIAPNSKQFIYARIKDIADNEVIINSQGIVIYTNTLISPDSKNFDKKIESQANVEVTMTLNDNTLICITNGSYILKLNDDYVINNNIVSIKKEYLRTLENGVATIAFNYYPMGIVGNTIKSSTLNIKITDTSAPTYTVTIPQKLEVGELVKTMASSIKVVPLHVQATGVSNFNKFNKQLKITVQSANGNKLKNAAATPDFIDYSLYSSYTDETTNTPLNVDGLIMNVQGTADNDKNISKSFDGALTIDTKNIKTEGNYEDILIFTVSLEEKGN